MPVTAPPSLTAVPDFPALADRATGTYNSKAYNWATHVADVLSPELQALGANVYANATEASVAGAASSAAIAAANFKGQWSTLTGALAIPASVAHNGKTWLLLANVADVTAHTPGVSANWQDTTAISLAQIQAAALSF